MRIMRDTSVRRRSPRQRVYRGVESGVVRDKGRDVSVPENDPEAVQCDHCGAFVKRLSKGQPRAHAAGGIATNTRAGRYACPGSGSLS